jgi:hypothetical protein
LLRLISQKVLNLIRLNFYERTSVDP